MSLILSDTLFNEAISLLTQKLGCVPSGLFRQAVINYIRITKTMPINPDDVNRWLKEQKEPNQQEQKAPEATAAKIETRYEWDEKKKDWMSVIVRSLTHN